MHASKMTDSREDLSQAFMFGNKILQFLSFLHYYCILHFFKAIFNSHFLLLKQVKYNPFGCPWPLNQVYWEKTVNYSIHHSEMCFRKGASLTPLSEGRGYITLN